MNASKGIAIFLNEAALAIVGWGDKIKNRLKTINTATVK